MILSSSETGLTCGVDLHKWYATISVRDEVGREIAVVTREQNLRRYVEDLGPKVTNTRKPGKQLTLEPFAETLER